MPQDKHARAMTRPELEDEVMLLRAQVKVLQDWVRLAKAGKAVSEPPRGLDTFLGIGGDYVGPI